MTEKLTFEEAMEKLKASAEALKREDIPLEDAIKAYEDGINHYKQCKDILDEAKQKIEIYSK